MLKNILSYTENIDHTKLALQLTLIDLILHPIGVWEIRSFILILSILGLIIPDFIKSYVLWLLLALLTLTRVIYDWPLADNHAYLLSFWCFAIFLSILRKDQNLLKVNAKLMIGLVFLFAFIWKAFLSSDYIDKRFFSLEMIEDPRFSEFTEITCSYTKNELLELHDYIKQHVDGSLIPSQIINFDLNCINKISGFLTYYTLIIEFLVALFFLLPRRIPISKYRDYILIVFCLTIYSVATVEGFGWLLLAMGLAQSSNGKRIALLYIFSYLIILLYREIPFADIILNLINK